MGAWEGWLEIATPPHTMAPTRMKNDTSHPEILRPPEEGCDPDEYGQA